MLPTGKSILSAVKSRDIFRRQMMKQNRGERPELKSFYNGKTKLSIETEGNSCYLSNKIRISDCGYDYDIAYLKDGMEYEILPFTKTKHNLFKIARTENYNEENSVQTWFNEAPAVL